MREHPGLQRKFQESQCYTEKPWLKKPKPTLPKGNQLSAPALSCHFDRCPQLSLLRVVEFSRRHMAKSEMTSILLYLNVSTKPPKAAVTSEDDNSWKSI